MESSFRCWIHVLSARHIPQKDLMILAALSHSSSRVAGQKASRWTRPLARLTALLVLLLLAALILILARLLAMLPLVLVLLVLAVAR